MAYEGLIGIVIVFSIIGLVGLFIMSILRTLAMIKIKNTIGRLEATQLQKTSKDILEESVGQPIPQAPQEKSIEIRVPTIPRKPKKTKAQKEAEQKQKEKEELLKKLAALEE